MSRRGGRPAPDPSYAALKELVVGATGLAYYWDKDDLFLERLQRRLSARGIDNYRDYLGLIRSGVDQDAEFDDLIADLTIGETCFFRDRDQCAALRDRVLPECLERNRAHRRVRIWSAGCSTGAEPYSLAILLDEMLAGRAETWDVTILGTDLNRQFLDQAERGVFGEWAVRNVPEARRRQYFSRCGRAWRIRDRFRQHVSFLHHNLAAESFPPIASSFFDFDLVLCRNVMIYFDEKTNRRLIDQFDQALRAGGWLLVGPAEVSFYLNERFAPVAIGGAHVHRKRDQKAVVSVDPPPHGTSLQAGSNDAKRLLEMSPPGWPDGGNAAVAEGEAPPAPLGAGTSRLDPRSGARPSTKGQDAAPARQRAGAVPPPSLDEIIALADRGAWHPVAEGCRARLEADPFDTSAYYYLALGLQGMGATSAAEEALRRAIYLDRELALAHYQLGVIRKNSGDPANSEKFFRNAHLILERLDDCSTVSFCGQVSALDLRRIVALQLERIAS